MIDHMYPGAFTKQQILWLSVPAAFAPKWKKINDFVLDMDIQSRARMIVFWLTFYYSQFIEEQVNDTFGELDYDTNNDILMKDDGKIIAKENTLQAFYGFLSRDHHEYYAFIMMDPGDDPELDFTMDLLRKMHRLYQMMSVNVVRNRVCSSCSQNTAAFLEPLGQRVYCNQMCFNRFLHNTLDE